MVPLLLHLRAPGHAVGMTCAHVPMPSQKLAGVCMVPVHDAGAHMVVFGQNAHLLFEHVPLKPQFAGVVAVAVQSPSDKHSTHAPVPSHTPPMHGVSADLFAVTHVLLLQAGFVHEAVISVPQSPSTLQGAQFPIPSHFSGLPVEHAVPEGVGGWVATPLVQIFSVQGFPLLGTRLSSGRLLHAPLSHVSAVHGLPSEQSASASHDL